MTAVDTSTHAHADGSHGAGHDHGHSEYPFLKHHFDSPAQQFDSGKLGMWLFLATEILFFGALFAMYAIMRFREPHVFAYASHYLDTRLGGINTCVLIASSLTMAMGVHYAQRSKTTGLIVCLFLTFLGACGFLVIKYFEYAHKFHDNLKWGPAFYVPPEHAAGEHAPAPHANTPLVDPSLAKHDAAPAHAPAPTPPADAHAPATTAAAATAPVGPPPFVLSAPTFKTPEVEASTIPKGAIGPKGVAVTPTAEGPVAAKEEVETGHGPHIYDKSLPVNTHRFFAIYYCMTGLHGIHVVIGMFLMVWLMLGALKGRFNSNYFTPVDLGGLYWHIVDLIWIFLFPLFYLIH